MESHQVTILCRFNFKASRMLMAHCRWRIWPVDCENVEQKPRLKLKLNKKATSEHCESCQTAWIRYRFAAVLHHDLQIPWFRLLVLFDLSHGWWSIDLRINWKIQRSMDAWNWVNCIAWEPQPYLSDNRCPRWHHTPFQITICPRLKSMKHHECLPR